MSVPTEPMPEQPLKKRRVWQWVLALPSIALVVLVCAVCGLFAVGSYLPCGLDDFAGGVGPSGLEGRYRDEDSRTVATLAGDGTFVVEGSPIGTEPVDGFGYPLADGRGTWTLERVVEEVHVEFRYETETPGEEPELGSLEVTGDGDGLVLWEYIGDPDSCDLAEFTTAEG